MRMRWFATFIFVYRNVRQLKWNQTPFVQLRVGLMTSTSKDMFGSGLTANITNSYYQHELINGPLLNLNSATSETKVEIDGIINKILEHLNSGNDLRSLNPILLTSSTSILTKGRFYEDVITSKLKQSCGVEYIANLEKIDAFLRGFISAERKKRSRLKVNYVLAGAECNKLERAVRLLGLNDEIDEELFIYLDSLIKKEILRATGPTVRLFGDETDSNDSELEQSVTGVYRTTLKVLRMVERRLKAEINAVATRAEVKLLAQLLNERDSMARLQLIKDNLNRIELLTSFTEFLKEGIAHLAKKEEEYIVKRGRKRGSKDEAEGYDVVYYKEEDDGDEKLSMELPPGVIEQMKDILFEVNKLLEKLKTGLSDSCDQYSTNKEDYLN